jgi:hypothetical protein
MKLKPFQTIRIKLILKLLNPRGTHGTSNLQIQRRKKLQSSVKNMHNSINPEEILTEIEKLGHTVTNI